MSHFTCFTIGDVDDIMAKYNEQDEKYYQPIEDNVERSLNVFHNLDDYAETKALFYKQYTDDASRADVVTFFAWYEDATPVYKEEDLEAFFKAKKRVFLVEDGKITKSFYYTNPNAKYDYYAVIGKNMFARWGDLSFLMKDGSRASHGLIKDLDIDGTIEECIEKDREEYRNVLANVGQLTHVPWNVFRNRVEKEEITIDEARDFYNKQESVEKFERWTRENHLWLEADNYLCTEDEFVKNTTFPVFCANILGEWLEKGEMGWWGIVSDRKEPERWKKLIEEKLHEAQDKYPDEEFNVLDCHI